MLNITLPSIAVQVVTNGYVVQWYRKTTELERKKSSEQRVSQVAIAATDVDLLAAIATAAKDIAEF